MNSDPRVNRPVSQIHRCMAILVAAVIPSIVTWVYFVTLAGDASRLQQIAFGIGKGLQFAFPLFWVVLVAREDWPPVAPHNQGSGAGLTWGAGSGLVILLAMAALYHLVLEPNGYFDDANSQIIDKVQGFGVDSTGAYFFLAAFYAVIHSVLEEYYWRWFVFGQLSKLTSFGAAALFSSLGFMAHHVILLAVYFGWKSPLTYFFSLCVAVGGLVWAWLYRRTDSLVGPWLSHFFADAGIFLIGYEIVQSVLT